MIYALIEHLDRCMNCARDSHTADPKIFFNQAFGAVQYHCIEHPDDQEKVEKLWDEYRRNFNILIYGA